MRIRMTGDFTYDLDEVGRERTLPKGGVFDEPDAVAEAAVEAGRAVRLDPAPDAEEAAEPATDGPSDPAAAAAPAARKPRS